MKKSAISTETQQKAMAMAKATQKPGQTKEQTKLIAAGIEKGIAEYKKQQKAQARQKDKARKQQVKSKQNQHDELASGQEPEYAEQSMMTPVAWALLLLLALSWLGFAVYYFN
ncbi:DUF2956 family protein [Shewanella gaetbuli]|uniref:DUF2956 domain-containing protein n=1 Tax=Shewanella gaetbuli TaxID=220752 RepID=A0A9X2CLL4_9GAMM|nr:DUF2956 family protein [Shewanella gaetbuli]MCL1142864.1 DUF2956 domain-containing protein [Shewanella gaetbuli]